MGGRCTFVSWRLAVAVVLAIIGCCTIVCHAHFDYFLFTREWPATFCQRAKCKIRPANVSEFTIHGLWPQNNDNTWPQYCDPGYPFDESEIEDLLADMEEDWPSLLLKPFWKHEWEKHGTCALDVFPNQHDYFAAVLQLHKVYDLEDALAADAIVPHPSRRYKLSDIQNAFREHLGSVPQLECQGGELNEVRMCVSKELEPFDCPETSRSCPSSVKLPPFPGEQLSSKKSGMPCSKVMRRVWNIVPAARACPYTVGAMLLAALVVLAAAVLLVVHRRAAAERRNAFCTYTSLPGSDSKLPL